MKMRKKLLRKVALRFFEDDANGEWGVAHKETMEGHDTEGFNAFWDGRGLFHDVFEHAHEFTDRFFRGDAALNIGGEVAAMGSLWYFYSQCGYHARLSHTFRSPDDIAIQSTLADMQESIEYGNTRYGNVLECDVPPQKETDDYTLEHIISEHFERIQACIADKNNDEGRNDGALYKQSVTLEKLANLYRYGYRMAEKLLPNSSYENGATMKEFSSFWDEFCKKNDAEQLANLYKGIDFSLYRDGEGRLHWTAKLERKYGISSDEVGNITLKGGPEGCPNAYSLTY